MLPRHPTILIADDDRGLVEAMTIRLHAAGYHVIACLDGDDALTEACGQHPDVIVLDVNMPGGTGQDVHEQLRNLEELGDTPVIYVTGKASPEDEQKARDLGAAAFMRKPVEPEALIGAICGALGIETTQTA